LAFPRINTINTTSGKGVEVAWKLRRGMAWSLERLTKLRDQLQVLERAYPVG